MKAIRKIINCTFIMVFAIILNVSAADYTDDYMTNFIDNTSAVLNSYSIDKLPKAQIKYKLLETDDLYQIRLTVDGSETDIVNLYTAERLTAKTMEFPVVGEGSHQLRLELLKNRESVYSKEYTVDYIKKISNVSYTDRGFNTHFSHNTYYAQDAELIEAIGANAYREAVYWRNVELSKNNYNFNTLDTRLSKMNNNTQNKIFVLTGTSPLYLNDNDTEKIVTQTQIEAFANFAVATATHYPDVLCFEIYNEPQFEYSGEEYSAIVLETAKRLKAYNPNICVYAGSVVDNDNLSETGAEFTNSFFDEELYPYIDGISYHIYTVGYFADCAKWTTHTDALLTKIRNSGGWKKFGVTETGWYIIPGDWGPVEETQASELVKRGVMAADKKISPLTFYELKCNVREGASQEEQNWGIYSNDYRMRKSFYALKNYFNNTNQAQLLGKIKLDGIASAYAYVNNDECFIIAWAPSPENTDINIRKSYKLDTSSYTFDDDVFITDLYGNEIAGNVLNTSYAPQYVYGVSRDFIMTALRQEDTEELINDSLFEGTKYSTAQIKQKYDDILTQKTEESVKEYLRYCLNFGVTIINDYNSGSANLTVQQLSSILSEIEKAAEKGGNLIACFDIAEIKKPDKILKLQYDQFEGLIEFSDLVGLSYLSEPYKKGKELLNMSERYEKSNRIEPIIRENYTIDALGNIIISGEASCNIVTIIIFAGDEKIVVDAIPVNAGRYSVTYKLPEFGEYRLEINEDTRISENIDYFKTEYKSVEAKIMNSNIIIADGLREWSKLLMENYLEQNKDYTFAEKSIDDYELETIDGKEYIVISDNDVIGTSMGAIYDESGRMITFSTAESNVMRLDITDLHNYRIKIFRWNNFGDMEPIDKVGTYLPIVK
jgi:hypothetical protein